MIKITLHNGDIHESPYGFQEIMVTGTTHFLVTTNPVRLVSILDLMKIERTDVEIPGVFSPDTPDQGEIRYCIEDYQSSKFLVSNGTSIDWADNENECSLYNEDTARLNLHIIESALGKSMVRMRKVEYQKEKGLFELTEETII
jgi:hypothetical protein